MNFFQDELRKIVGPAHPNALYAGRACFIKLGEVTRAKVELVTLLYGDRYDGLKATVLNRNDGPLDTVTLRFGEILGKKRVSNPNFRDGIKPFLKVNGETIGWYVYSPTQADYQMLGAELEGYLGVFQEHPSHRGERPEIILKEEP